ncbi:MAG: hypothetical protein RLZZ01_1773 [Actinomycetota bacterium]
MTASVIDPLRAPESIGSRRPGGREVIIVHDPIHYVWNCRPTTVGEDVDEFTRWAMSTTPNAMSRTLAAVFGIAWFRSRLDDVLAVLDEAWLVLRADHLAESLAVLDGRVGSVEQADLAKWITSTAPPPALELVDDLRLRTRHDADDLLHRLAGRFEQQSLHRLLATSTIGGRP